MQNEGRLRKALRVLRISALWLLAAGAFSALYMGIYFLTWGIPS